MTRMKCSCRDFLPLFPLWKRSKLLPPQQREPGPEGDQCLGCAEGCGAVLVPYLSLKPGEAHPQVAAAQPQTVVICSQTAVPHPQAVATCCFTKLQLFTAHSHSQPKLQRQSTDPQPFSQLHHSPPRAMSSS